MATSLILRFVFREYYRVLDGLLCYAMLYRYNSATKMISSYRSTVCQKKKVVWSSLGLSLRRMRSSVDGNITVGVVRERVSISYFTCCS
jgi:hypothetical protein